MIVVILGPTGVGKTKLSVELAKKIDAEIINADSMQVYKGLDIATAKVREEEKDGIPHHLFDICEVIDNYSVFDYQKDARKKLEELQEKGKNIIVVGGTGLYIKALLYDYEFLKEDKVFDFSLYSSEKLLEEIKKYDENFDIDIKNRRRLERYLAKCYQDTLLPKKGNNPLYDFKMIGLTTDRDILYERINNRVLKMVDDGVIEEARKFYDADIYTKPLTGGIGYKELYQYFDGAITLEDAISLIQKNSRHYAKRQYTFFKNQLDVTWFDVNFKDFNKTIEEVLEYLKK